MRKKNLLWLGVIVGILGLLRASPSLAVTLGFAPSVQMVQLGDTVAVDIIVGALGSDVVSGFDLDVGFDPLILNFIGVIFGPHLGNPDPLAFETLTGVDVSLAAAGVVNVAEVSFLLDFELAPLQATTPFPLVSLSFEAIGLGTSRLTFPEGIIGVFAPEVKNGVGDPLGLTINEGRTNVVPEPSTMVLLGTGLVGLLGYGWRRRKETA